MKIFDRELELGFEVSAAKAIKIMTRENLVILNQNIIHQTWLEEGEVGDYKFRTRIRRTEIKYPGVHEPFAGKCEYTTKYSKNDERAAAQDNMELNAPLTAKEYGKLFEIYSAEVDLKKTRKIRTYFKDGTGDIYALDSYPDSDKARVEIEFQSEKAMDKWMPPQWLLTAIAAAKISKKH